jgi:hypothetical protein
MLYFTDYIKSTLHLCADFHHSRSTCEIQTPEDALARCKTTEHMTKVHERALFTDSLTHLKRCLRKKNEPQVTFILVNVLLQE